MRADGDLHVGDRRLSRGRAVHEGQRPWHGVDRQVSGGPLEADRCHLSGGDLHCTALLISERFVDDFELVAPGRVRTLARSVDGRLMPPVEYDLAGTPCADVLDGNVCHVRSGAAERYPRDEGLTRLSAESYVGVALRAASGELLGLVNAIHATPG